MTRRMSSYLFRGRTRMKRTYRYESDNGYRCTMIGTEMTIRDGAGRLVFHTYNTGCRTEQDMRDFVDRFPEFLKMMGGE